ncbi:glycosyltransferase family 2 protein [Brachyspira intermedia]|uniref:glycosyltransferase family 2 protein n=1 Tax=Brachyspira intermedia TaxID=84377 RepID=UPI003006BA82
MSVYLENCSTTEKNEPFFSVVVPVYNTEKYLPRCIESILNQTFKDIEIIIVNDCSPQNCEEIVQSYKDGRIKYIKHEINKGTLSARKTGSIEANGKYITYLDSDDELVLNAFEVIYNNIDKDYDVLHFSVKSISKNPNKKERLKEEKYTSWYLSSKRNYIDNNYLFHEMINEKIPHNVYAKVFKKEIIKKTFNYIPDDHIIFAEDMLQCLITFYFIKSYKSISNELYIYYNDISFSNKNINNLSTEKFENMCQNCQCVLNIFYDFLQKMHIEKLYYYEYLKIVYNQYNFLLNKTCNENEYISILNKYFNNIIEEYKHYEYIHNYYLKQEKKLKEINDELLPYFFYIIIDEYYININVFGIKINLKKNTCSKKLRIISLNSFLKNLFSINKNSKYLKILFIKIKFK